tara:strand:+ start:398 stop:637 length:240 start_codon:yes stop_codon:yes gene_type:complete
MHVQPLARRRECKVGAPGTHLGAGDRDSEIRLVDLKSIRATVHGGYDTHASYASSKGIQTTTTEHIYEVPRRRRRGIIL